MSSNSVLQDLLDDDLKENNIRMYVKSVYNLSVSRDRTSLSTKTRLPQNAKSLLEIYALIGRAIDNYEDRANTPSENKVIFTEEEPDRFNNGIVVTVSLIERLPGAFGKGAPGDSTVRNMTPRLREEVDDETHPGYKLATYGYFHDNIVRLTLWAKTNKVANQKVEWLENLMQEYTWWFNSQGVTNILYHSRSEDLVRQVDSNKWYGRPINYFIRTETLRVVSEKTIEEIILSFTIANS